MSRPAAPESPATEQCLICLAHPPYGDCAGDEACAYILTLERQLDLAQTEIKGHMRGEDELRAENVALREERDKHYARLAGLLFSGVLDEYTCGEVQSWAAIYTKNLTEAQSRIAELEGHIRVLTRPAWNSEGHMLPTLPQVEAARAALKSRA